MGSYNDIIIESLIECFVLVQKNYDFAENAISSQSMVNIGANSPERDARQIKKISPYDCFRSGEARQTIVQCKKEVEREMES